MLLLAAKPCSQCLTTRSRIVPAARASSIIRSCRRDGTHFVCHKAPPGQVVHCRGVHDALGGSAAHRFALACGIPVREIDPDTSP